MVVGTDSVIEKRLDALDAMPSQFYEVGANGSTALVPSDPDKKKARANAVLEWLTAHGIDGARLIARGYGQERPIAPNVTPTGRARNRRVQFMILH